MEYKDIQTIKNDDIEKITKKDRSPLVRDLEYGDIRTNNLESLDIPEKSILEYDETKELRFEDYEELTTFLEDYFIPKYIAIKQGKINGEYHDYFSIQLNYITKLRVSEKEMEYIFNYLKNKGIRIGGMSSTVEADNYDYVRTYKDSPLPKMDSTFNNVEKIKEYQETKDLVVREQIIINNLRLVKYVASKYAAASGKNIHEIEDYGYEGLMKAIDNFDPSLGFMFSTYAYSCIRGYILRGMQNESIFGNDYYSFVMAKKVVEDETMLKLESSPEILDEILELMVETGRISNMRKEDFRKKILLTMPMDITDEEVLETTDLNDITIEAENTVLRDNIIKVLQTLNPREQEVLILRFGLDGGNQLTLDEVGEHFGLSRERVRQIEVKALRKLRHPSRAKPLKDFLGAEKSEMPMNIPSGRKL